MEKIKVYKYLDKEFKARTKSFKPYRVKAILFSNRYDEFENKYISDLTSEIQNFLMTDKKVSGLLISAKNTGDEKQINKVVSEALIKNPQYAVKATELSKKKLMARELFILTDENANELCEIMLEDGNQINHNPDTEEDYQKYLTFIEELLADFFLKYRAQQNMLRV